MAAFDLSSSITSTSGISVSASGASAYTLSGNDRDGSVSGNNATVNTNVGDILNFVVFQVWFISFVICMKHDVIGPKVNMTL